MQAFNLKASLAALAILALPVVQAASMSKDEYGAGKSRITAEYKTAKDACGSFAGNAKDICVEEAKAKEKVARAELEYGYSGKAEDQNKIMVAKAEGAYAVAREKCDDKAGNEKDVCVQVAKAAETKALADAKLNRKVGAARSDASEDKREATYKVAAERCNAFSGEAKSSCLVDAKLKFGKS